MPLKHIHYLMANVIKRYNTMIIYIKKLFYFCVNQVKLALAIPDISGLDVE
jgi:hypothetical protein